MKIYPGNSHSHDENVCAGLHEWWDELREVGIKKYILIQ